MPFYQEEASDEGENLTVCGGATVGMGSYPTGTPLPRPSHPWQHCKTPAAVDFLVYLGPARSFPFCQLPESGVGNPRWYWMDGEGRGNLGPASLWKAAWEGRDTSEGS